MTKSIVYIDSEIGIDDKRIKDLGAIKNDRSSFHSPSLRDFYAFISDADFVCGHNIVHHDLAYLTSHFEKPLRCEPVDTLYLSPLLFPCRPYHKLVKDDKLQVDQLNNPLNDAEKAMQLLADEVNAFQRLSSKVKQIYCCLLYDKSEFKGFFDYVGFVPYRSNVPKLIREEYDGKICANANVELMVRHYPVELAYSKYRTDLEEFIKESQFEDFYTDDRETVFVSTIHKSKGREFDSVWLLLNHTVLRDDAERRKLYVGMTRAKDNLYIHCNNGIFDTYQISGVDQFVDEEQYPEPQEITLQLTHKDVVLDFFKDKKEIIFKLHSGMPLSIKDEFLYAELDGRTVKVAKLSKARMLELEKLSAKGYRPCGGEVRFVVAWKGESDIEETAVLLPNLHFKKD